MEGNSMRFGKCSGLLAAAALALVWSVPAGATDISIPGKITIVKPGLFKIVAKPTGSFTLPGIGSGSDPVANGGSVHVFDTDGSGSFTDPLSVVGGWSGLGNPAGSKGYKYKNTSAPSGGQVKIIVFKGAVIKIIAKDTGSLTAPVGGNLAAELNTGTDRRCADFGGTEVKNQTDLYKHKDAPATGSCAVLAPPCCSSATHLNFTNNSNAGDCGDVIDAVGMVVSNV